MMLLFETLPVRPCGLITNPLAFKALSFPRVIPVFLSSSARLILLTLYLPPSSSLNSSSTCVKIFCKLFLDLYDKNRRSIGTLSEEKQTRYDRLAHSSAQPVPVEWKLPKVIDFTVSDEAQAYDKHLFGEDGGSAHIFLNSWERSVLLEEIDEAVCWLAKFAEKHGVSFGRIQLIREHTGPDGKKHFYRLDMSKTQIRNKVRAIKSNDELDAIFEELSERKI